MKALKRSSAVECFVYTGSTAEIYKWLKTNGYHLSEGSIYKDDKKVSNVYERDIIFFNHFVIDGGVLYKMTEEKFNQDYVWIS